MKKILLSLVALFATVSLVSGAITYNVTVPAGTNECYIAGDFASQKWKHIKMTKQTATTYTITIADATETSKYKYCSGPDWMFVEKPASGTGDVLDRTWVSGGDIVAKWAQVYDPGVQIVRADLTFKIQISTGTPTIWWWGGDIPAPTMPFIARPEMTAEGNWFTYSFSQVDVTNGLSIQILDGETS
nr:hypothetical protein [Paludibacteraceae bacterium]